MEANWALYIACIGAVLAIAGCVLLWLEGMMICRTVGNIRYQQLRQKRDIYENERDPTDFIYSPPARSRPGMYGGPVGVTYGPAGGSYAPPRTTYRPPPSVSGVSTEQSESAYTPREVSREIDL